MNSVCRNCGLAIRCLENEYYQISKDTLWTHVLTGLVSCTTNTRAQPPLPVRLVRDRRMERKYGVAKNVKIYEVKRRSR